MATQQGPAWDLESLYPRIDSPAWQRDFSRFVETIHSLRELPTTTKNASVAFALIRESEILFSTLRAYLHCCLSVDSTDAIARATQSRLEMLGVEFEQVFLPWKILIRDSAGQDWTDLQAQPELQTWSFQWQQWRAVAPFRLSSAEETLLSALGVSGHSAWSNLYFDLSGKLRVPLRRNGDVQFVGLAQAQSMTRESDREVREIAWRGIQETWTDHRESAAAILNALAGWRLAVEKKRSHTKPMHFLDQSLQQSCIRRETLAAMIQACWQRNSKVQAVIRTMADQMGVKQLAPWDSTAPFPQTQVTKPLPFADAVQSVARAFAGVSPELGDFVKMAAERKWIEGRVLPNKTVGAYCTGFATLNEPRVFLTYSGSDGDVTTMAHELGHAFHGWTIRDLPWEQQSYPMTLAETASVFAETVYRDESLRTAQSEAERRAILWTEAEAAMGFLVNIPVRFEFESEFYRRRQDSIVSADELSAIMSNTWNKWYGDTMSEPDKMFWASKLHFAIDAVSFYNYPYTFGYLFSLSIYARREKLGAQFWPAYKAILRDTGRKGAEDLIREHLGEDITQPEFWLAAIDALLGKFNVD